MVKSLTFITDEELMQMSSQNPELRFERNADGTITQYPATAILSGEDVVPGFTLVLETLF
nr:MULTISPECIES: hypothetical protein [unclassified Coleofasciculus]